MSENRENGDVKETPKLNVVGNSAEIGRESVKRDEAAELLRKLDELLIMNEDSAKVSFDGTRCGFQYQDYPFYNRCVRRRQQGGSHVRTHFPSQNADRYHFRPYRPCSNVGRYRNLGNNHNHLSEPCGFVHRPHKKAVPTTAPPLHGGAPFVTCCNCLELLQVPNSVFLADKTPRKLKCWACWTTLLLIVVGKKLRVSALQEMTDFRPNRARARASMNFSSQDWDWETNPLGLSKSAELRSVESGSTFSSEDEEIGPRKLEPINCLDEKKTTHKAKASSLAGIIKKSFKEKFSRTADQTSINVTVNGQPIPDRLLKKAEKLAGPIQPGNYWYDVRAGFWGLMNGPCLGIIPPLIEELNHPIDKKCAGGNTGVFVNGRELHQKDLQLLSMRGLPTIKGRSYTIEISGRIWDDESGGELDSLGKLAPTVEMAKHGFGMKPPKLRV